MNEAGLSAGDVEGTGRRGQILKEDVIAATAKAPGQTAAPAAASAAPAPNVGAPAEAKPAPRCRGEARAGSGDEAGPGSPCAAGARPVAQEDEAREDG